MQIRYDASARTAEVPLKALCAFARRRPGAPHGFHRSAGTAETPPDAREAVPLSLVREETDYTVRVTGEMDLCARDGALLVCETRRAVRRSPAYLDPGQDPAQLCEAMLGAYLLCEAEAAESAAIRIVYVRESDGEARAWEGMFARAVLARAFETVYARAKPFLDVAVQREAEGRAALSRLRFPYPSVREGQRELMDTLYRCVRRGQRLLASAPTGIGKTVSTLYPSLRAVGAREADRIFYFTAKTVTGGAALDAVRAMRAGAPTLRAIRLTAKERVCPLRAGHEEERDRCRHCPRLAAAGGLAYEERRDAALLELLADAPVADAKEIAAAAERHAVCPYELSLDLSEYCEVIVCDYGYLLDPHVRLRRYFAEDRGERTIFLVDEAHNLPDRAREIYSASLTRTEIAAFAAAVTAALPDDRALADACEAAGAALDGLDALCAAEATEEEGGLRGFSLLPAAPDFFLEAIGRLRAAADEYLRRDWENAAPLFLDMRDALRRFADAAAWADEGFACYLESAGGETTARVMCLDPARLLSKEWARGVTAVLFSATLSPMEYYADVCGCPDAVRLELPSPYERDNLCLVTVDAVSTRYSQRAGTAADVAEWIAAVTESREGNYIVYFPSYRYMTDVCRQYLRAAPGTHVILQKPGMSLRERDRFLREFERCAASGEGVVAFCVLGGIFSEGIDLAGEALIGTVIVGIGLPGLSSELNILSEYYEKTRERGHDYAYLYPAMNKILQAAGRVIRSERDRGVVVLIDDRYADPGVRALFPAHWSRMQYTADPYTLGVILSRFWEEGDTEGKE